MVVPKLLSVTVKDATSIGDQRAGFRSKCIRMDLSGSQERGRAFLETEMNKMGTSQRDSLVMF